jgi:hypothetical protein
MGVQRQFGWAGAAYGAPPPPPPPTPYRQQHDGRLLPPHPHPYVYARGTWRALREKLLWIAILATLFRSFCTCGGFSLLTPSYATETETAVLTGILSMDKLAFKHPVVVQRRQHASNETAAICVMVKNEQLYIDEFVDYHLAIGFDTIYVYDNSNDFNMKEWGEQKKNVQVVHHVGEGMQQEAAYQECYKQVRMNKSHAYLAFFDPDELLIMRKHSHIMDLMQEYCKRGSLSFNWYNFGTSNQTRYEPIPVSKRFLYRTKKPEKFVKTIGRVMDVVDRGNNTFGIYVHKQKVVTGDQKDTNGKILHGSFNPNGPTNVAVIHHYFSKSVEEFYVKVCVRGSTRLSNMASNDYCGTSLRDIPIGEVYDDSAWRAVKKFLPHYYNKFTDG